MLQRSGPQQQRPSKLLTWRSRQGGWKRITGRWVSNQWNIIFSKGCSADTIHRNWHGMRCLYIYIYTYIIIHICIMYVYGFFCLSVCLSVCLSACMHAVCMYKYIIHMCIVYYIYIYVHITPKQPGHSPEVQTRHDQTSAQHSVGQWSNWPITRGPCLYYSHPEVDRIRSFLKSPH